MRKLPLARVQTLIDDNTDGRSLGVLGEPGVNVTTSTSPSIDDRH